MTIVGGRNIADEYFGAGTDLALTDLDVAAVGEAVREVSSQFDLYWNSASAYPARRVIGAAPNDVPAQPDFTPAGAGVPTVDLEAMRAMRSARALVDGSLALEWTTSRLVHDDPVKTLGEPERNDALLFTQLVQSFGRVESTLDLVSPYFVPGDAGTGALVALAQRGVKIRILTNSLAAAEASAVHAGYAKRREALLRAGIELWELKPVPGAGKGQETNVGPSVGTALHAKTYAADRMRIFVGSFNFDPRSAHLNTEMGLVIDSPTLAQRLAHAFETSVPERAWRVRLASDQQTLEWIERTASGETVYTTEPQTGWFRRFRSGFMAVMPIEWLL